MFLSLQGLKKNTAAAAATQPGKKARKKQHTEPVSKVTQNPICLYYYAHITFLVANHYVICKHLHFQKGVERFAMNQEECDAQRHGQRAVSHQSAYGAVIRCLCVCVCVFVCFSNYNLIIFI